MQTTDVTSSLAGLFAELVEGVPTGREAFILNSGDIGLLRSLDKLSAADASRSVNEGATIAAHARHLQYGLSLMNRWAREGGNPFADATWDEAWKTSVVDDTEWTSIRRAPRLSARLLQRFDFVAAQARAVELHRERMDGTGYYGVAGEELPLASHFLIVADSFDAMTSDRPYRRAMPVALARAEMVRHAGAQFDPAVVEAFLRVLDS